MLLTFYSTNECKGGQRLLRTSWRYWSSQRCCCTCASTDQKHWSSHFLSLLCWCAQCQGYGIPHRPEPLAITTGHAHHFGLTLIPEQKTSEQSGKLISEMRSTVFGAQPLLLQMCFWKEAQTLKYLSVRGEELCCPNWFQPWRKGPEEPVFLHLKKGVRASLNTGKGNTSADRDEIIPRGAVFLLF